MKTVLTIDFDIIMAPCIELYNNLVPQRDWDFLLSFPNMKNLEANFFHYKKLTEFLIRIFKTVNKNNVHFIEDHGIILKYLDKNEVYNIINIDHHHDCGYAGSEKKEVNCGNWLYKIYETGKLNSYTWINNSSSTAEKKDTKNLITNKYTLKDYELENFNEKIDELIICLSEPWVPPYLRPLFFTWIDLANNFYNTHFEVDFTRCGNENQNKLFLSD